MRDDYLQAAQAVIPDPYILVNVISRRVKQLRQGNRPLVESLEKLALEDIAFREVAEGKISYQLAEPEAPPSQQFQFAEVKLAPPPTRKRSVLSER